VHSTQLKTCASPCCLCTVHMQSPVPRLRVHVRAHSPRFVCLGLRASISVVLLEAIPTTWPWPYQPTHISSLTLSYLKLITVRLSAIITVKGFFCFLFFSKRGREGSYNNFVAEQKKSQFMLNLLESKSATLGFFFFFSSLRLKTGLYKVVSMFYA